MGFKPVILIVSLRTAYANEYSLDKEQTNYSDGLDALRRMQDVQDEIKRKSSQLLSRALNISIVHYCVNVSIRMDYSYDFSTRVFSGS